MTNVIRSRQTEASFDSGRLLGVQVQGGWGRQPAEAGFMVAVLKISGGGL